MLLVSNDFVIMPRKCDLLCEGDFGAAAALIGRAKCAIDQLESS